MRTLTYETDLCVVGGGISGLCAALAAARHGARVVLIQDRPVLGGNASSEIRMWLSGAQGKDCMETGIVEEIECENFYQNTGLKYAVWDSVLYEIALAEPNLKMLLNTTCLAAECQNGHIAEVTGWQLNTQTYHKVRAAFFADCSGDSILAPLTGAALMQGREAKSDFGESIPPDVADTHTMGMSCLIQIRETDSPKKFIKPSFAYTYKTDADLPYKDHTPLPYNNFWWIEYGGMRDCLHDADECREELLKIAYGVWDHVKNQGDHGAENWELEWIGFLPGKRESVRYIGKYIVNENDVNAAGKFPDVVAYAGWTMDDHFPEGFYYTEGHPTIYHPAPCPWGFPFRALCARDIDNLLFAGRNASVTHAALSSTRVMKTCALMGQAVGTAVAQMIRTGTTPVTIDISALQSTLMDDDCFLPGFKRRIPEITKTASCTAEVVRDGCERGEEHLWKGKAGERITYSFTTPTEISGVRLVFDSDLNRTYRNMPATYLLDEPCYRVAKQLMCDYDLIFTLADGSETVKQIRDSHQRFVRIPYAGKVIKVTFVPLKTWGAEEFRIFDFELY